MVDQTQMSPSSISPLGLFQGIKYNIERLKGDIGALNLLGCGGGPQIPLYNMFVLFHQLFAFFQAARQKSPKMNFSYI